MQAMQSLSYFVLLSVKAVMMQCTVIGKLNNSGLDTADHFE